MQISGLLCAKQSNETVTAASFNAALMTQSVADYRSLYSPIEIAPVISTYASN